MAIKRQYGIYIIRSKIKPERIYVGSSARVNHRMSIHKTQLKHGRHNNAKLSRHVNKYGLDDLFFEVIETFDFISKEELLEREQYYINTLNPFFNISPCASSQLGCKRSDESKERYRNAVLGRRATRETRDKQRIAKIGVVPWNNGIPHSTETKRKISETKKKTGQLLPLVGILKKWIFQYDLKGNFINKFPNALAASAATKMDRKAIRRRCVLGNKKPLRGYVFIFVLVNAPERYYRM